MPFLEPENQSTYIWFLMFFPPFLVGLFFITLNFNHKVLYAPSDYKDEDNFFKSLKYASINERQEKINAEINELTSNDDESQDALAIKEESNTDNTQIKEPTLENEDESFLRTESNDQEKTTQDIAPRDHQHNNYKSTILNKILKAENLSLNYLSKELRINLQRDLVIKTESNESIIFDAIGVTPDVVHAVEVKYSKDGMVPLNTINKVMHLAEKVSSDFFKNHSQDFKFHLVIVVADTFFSKPEIERRILMHTSKYNVKTIVHIYSMGNLTKDI